MNDRSGPSAFDSNNKPLDTRKFYYSAQTSLGEILFQVPRHEMGENMFADQVPAQLLIRWGV